MVSTSQPHKGRWTPLGIFAVIAGFIIFWPLGLLAIGYILWGGSIDGLVDDTVRKLRDIFGTKPVPAAAPVAFEDYRNDILTRLETEQSRRAEHLRRLREAPDRAEFDRILAEQAAV